MHEKSATKAALAMAAAIGTTEATEGCGGLAGGTKPAAGLAFVWVWVGDRWTTSGQWTRADLARGMLAHMGPVQVHVVAGEWKEHFNDAEPPTWVQRGVYRGPASKVSAQL